MLPKFHIKKTPKAALAKRNYIFSGAAALPEQRGNNKNRTRQNKIKTF